MSQADPFHAHDHSVCAHDALARAEAHCRAVGARLTPVRRRTLEILLQEHKALGAYDVLEKLSADGFGSQPPVAYRALDFLVEHGLVHRIRRLNAFAACTGADSAHSPMFLICKSCESVAEIIMDDMRSKIELAGKNLGFTVERTNIEALGLCPSCAEA